MNPAVKYVAENVIYLARRPLDHSAVEDAVEREVQRIQAEAEDAYRDRTSWAAAAVIAVGLLALMAVALMAGGPG